jgi:hypothetical protein
VTGPARTTPSRITCHFGSGMPFPVCSSFPPKSSRQFPTSARMLNADAIGPNVPAMSGNPVAANHHRLEDQYQQHFEE